MRTRMVPLIMAGLAVAAGVTTLADQTPQQQTRRARHLEERSPGRRDNPAALTAPQAGGPEELALRYLQENAGSFGLGADDLQDVVVVSSHTSEHNSLTNVYLRQRYNGIDVHGANANINVTADGRILSAFANFVPGLAAAVRTTAFPTDAPQSAQRAAQHLGLRMRGPIEPMEIRGGVAQEMTLSDGGISRRPIPASLVYERLESGEVVLAWLLEIAEMETPHWWSLTMDASTGDLLEQVDLTVFDNWDVEPGRATAPSVGAPMGKLAPEPPLRIRKKREGEITGVPNSGTYRVFAQPKADPNDGDRILVANPADPTSSPFGWHDTNGAAGAESTNTTGNNVDAYTDINNNNNGNAPDVRANGGAGLLFDFPINFLDNPSAHRPAAVTNLFYWNNKVHDISYRYGFTESAGNFQVNQYGKFGAGGNDSVQAEAQDGGGMNNANFGTNVDGIRPRMQMFLWVPPGGYRVQAGASNFTAARANFGAFLSDSHVTQPSADIQAAGNGCTAAAFSGAGFVAGRIAYVTSGTCNNVVKSQMAQAAGAVGVIINTGQNDANLATMTGVTPVDAAGAATLTIPALGLSTSSSTALAALLPTSGAMVFLGTPAPLRDGDFDASVVIHEYTHGISNRLTGGRLTVSCLNNDEQMGEGWGDWMALAFTHDPARPVQRSRGLGPYIRFTGVDGAGIRPTRYSPDMTINPSTYNTISTVSIPHGVGYVWATMLWDMYWNLIDKHGFNPNVYDPWNTGGNNLAIQLVMDGMKLQPCSPGFVTGRNAILQADQVLTSGDNQCSIWKAFARRGLGVNAAQNNADNVNDGVESYETHDSCKAVAAVVPPTLTPTVECSLSTTQELTIKNTAPYDGTDLTWSIAEAAASCAAPGDVSWVSESPTSGTTAAQGQSAVQVTFNSSGLGAGAHSSLLCIATNATPKEVPLTLTVVDTTPPVISGVSATPSSLWPANHKMVDVVVSYTATDTCAGSVTSALSVTSNEPLNGLGDGDTSPDWEVVNANTVRLRAERSGTGTGRIYTITITATDAAGNTTTQAVPVFVPHSNK